MSKITIRNLSFIYDGFYEPVFEDLNCDIHLDWKLGLVGRNGMGKTTLLRLLQGELPYSGTISAPVSFDYFPFQLPLEQAGGRSALESTRQAIADYAAMESAMLAAAEAAAEDELTLARYGELEQRFQELDGYIIDELITAEAGKLGIDVAALERPFHSLSGGEATKLMLAALFLKKGNFLLIDEPTDHLDLEGRRSVAAYLSQKSGFILVSHDRRFLDEIIDHVLVLEKHRQTMRQGSFSSYLEDKRLEDLAELEQNERLEQQISSLERSSRQKRVWSGRREATKKSASDSGFVSARAARVMKRALAIEQRREDAIEEKRGLLRHIDYAPSLRIATLPYHRRLLVDTQELTLGYSPDHPLFAPLSFSISVGERIALMGPNGSGKSTLFKAILKELTPLSGSLRVGSELRISHVAQEADYLQGDLRQFALAQGIDESLFKAILRKLDFLRSDFEKEMQHYSQGEKKKVLLAASLCSPSHLYLWDEPLNYIDYYSREQIEKLLLEYQPTLLFIEHDRYFSEQIATKRVQLSPSV